MAGPEASAPVCPCCGGSSLAARWDAEWRLGPGKSVCWCSGCGYGWQEPVPEVEAIRHYYATVPIYNLHKEGEKEALFELRLARLAELRPERGLLLDVGAGMGHFLDRARHHGWNALGVEPQKAGVAYARSALGLEVHEGFLNDLDLPDASVDVLTIWDVLEHVHEPLHFLDDCLSLIRPDGLLALAIPNASGWPARLFRGRWRYVMGTHLSYFSMTFVMRELARRGWRLRRADHTIKAQSLVHSLASFAPRLVDSERLVRMGRGGVGDADVGSATDEEPPGKTGRPTLTAELAERLLGVARRLVLAVNRTSLPWPVGDLVDLYFERAG